MRGKSECFGGVCDARLDDFFVDGNARHGVDIAHRRHADDDDFVEPRRFRDVEKSNRLGLSAPIFEFNPRFFAQFTRAALAPRFVELHKSARKSPLPTTRINAASNEQHARAIAIFDGYDDVHNGERIAIRDNATIAMAWPRRRGIVECTTTKCTISFEWFCHDIYL